MLLYRNPTLPSPLRSYLSEQYHPPSRREASREAKISNANVSERKPAGAKIAPMDASRSTRVPKANKELAQITSELELVEKKNKKAELALATWEAALKHERKAQYKYLKERVRLQKQLIKQNDQYTQLLREEAELQRQKEVKAAQQARKDMITALRAHEENLRVHREKITRKLQLNAPDGSTKEDGLIDDDESQNVTSSLSPVSNKPRIMNILNMRSDSEICVEDMWRKVRAHSARKMRPVENHLQQLKRTSSPFIRDFLHKIETEGYQSDSNWNTSPNTRPFSAAAKKKNRNIQLMRSAAQQNEHHATFILYRNSPNHMGRESSTFDLTMYGFSADDLMEPYPSSRERYQTAVIEASVQTKHKKKLPLYLTKSGDILKSSSGSVDERLSFVSQTKSEPQNKTFLTQECSTTEISTSHSSLWEPLTLGTLQEYREVKTVPGVGPFQHGEPKLWKIPSSLS